MQATDSIPPTDPTAVIPGMGEEIKAKPKSLWRETLENLLRNQSAVVGLVLLGALLLIAIFAPLIATHDPEKVMIDIPEEGAVKRMDPCIHLLGCPKAGDELIHITADETLLETAMNNSREMVLGISGSTIVVWKTEDGSEFLRLPHEETVTAAAWTSNDQRILAASGEQLFVWDANTGNVNLTLEHPGGATHVAWSVDGTRFVSAGAQEVFFWIDCSQIAYSPACQGRTSFVEEKIVELEEDWTAISWRNDGSQLMIAVGSDVQLWTYSSVHGWQRRVVLAHTEPVASAQYNREGRRILTASGNTLRIWQPTYPYTVQTFEYDRPLAVGRWGEQTKEGAVRVQVLGITDNTVVAWDARTGELVHELSAAEDPLIGSAISPLATRYFGYGGNTVHVWDAGTGERLFSKDLGEPIQNVVWQPEGSSILVTGQDDLRVIKTSNYQYIMGTDGNIRDEFSRLIYATRVSLRVGVTSVTFAILVGTMAGCVAGYAGGWVDNIIMRIMDVMLAFPALILAIAVVTILGPGINNALLAISIVFIPAYARVARSGVLSVRENDYVMADRALGVAPVRILFRRILPNIMAPLIVQATLGIGTAILDAAALSFLGLGAQPPMAEWGFMLSEERNQLLTAPHLVIFPGVAIMITVLAFNLLGDGLRDVLDPRLNR